MHQLKDQNQLFKDDNSSSSKENYAPGKKTILTDILNISVNGGHSYSKARFDLAKGNKVIGGHR